MMNYFSDTYFESREKFRALVAENKGLLHARKHPEATGPCGETLSVDWAVFGSPSAHKVFFSLNGVHGNESYAGAAGQLQLIDCGALKEIPDEVAVVLVHNINPYGWAFDSQFNEDIVNLNRNFVNFENLPASDELHYAIEKTMTFEAFSTLAAIRAVERRHEVRETYGDERYWSEYVVGQYIAPKSINYGGTKAAWSNTVLRDIAAEHLKHAEKVAYIDWHTGVGDYGMPLELHGWAEGSAAWQRLAQWWGEDVVRRGAKGIFSGSDDEAGASKINGLAQIALFEAAPQASFCGGPVEFGTVAPQELSPASILDIWLQHEGKVQRVSLRPWKTYFHFVFAPCDPSWRQSVLAHAQRINQNTIKGLIEWNGK